MSYASFMQLALAQARMALPDEVPIGAIIVDSKGAIIAQAHNGNMTDHDPTAHAEIAAIRQACKTLGTQRLNECDIYVTLEPCPMCAAAISLARIKRVYFGAYDAKGGGVEHGPRIFNQPTCNHAPEVYGGIEEHAAVTLLQEFFQKKR